VAGAPWPLRRALGAGAAPSPRSGQLARSVPATLSAEAEPPHELRGLCFGRLLPHLFDDLIGGLLELCLDLLARHLFGLLVVLDELLDLLALQPNLLQLPLDALDRSALLLDDVFELVHLGTDGARLGLLGLELLHSSLVHRAAVLLEVLERLELIVELLLLALQLLDGQLLGVVLDLHREHLLLGLHGQRRGIDGFGGGWLGSRGSGWAP
jgi:hypothetical protein